MSPSRMPAFSPMAAKPSARLHAVVDLPTPPLAEATAMTCLTPGMPAALVVARACGSGRVVDTMCSSRSERIAFLAIACPQIIFRRHHGWPLWRAVRVKSLVDHGFDAAVRAHLDDIDAFGVGALEHPVFFAEFGEHAVDRAPGAEGFAAGDAVEGLLLLENAQRRVPCPEIQPRFERDDLFGTGRFAQSALHAEAFGEAQHGAIGIVR